MPADASPPAADHQPDAWACGLLADLHQAYAADLGSLGALFASLRQPGLAEQRQRDIYPLQLPEPDVDTLLLEGAGGARLAQARWVELLVVSLNHLAGQRAPVALSRRRTQAQLSVLQNLEGLTARAWDSLVQEPPPSADAMAPHIGRR